MIPVPENAARYGAAALLDHLPLQISRFASQLDKVPAAAELTWPLLTELLRVPRRAPCSAATCPARICPHGRDSDRAATCPFLGDAVYGTAKGNTNASDSVIVWRWSPDGFVHSPSRTDFGWSAYGGLAAAHGFLAGMTHGGSVNGRGAYFAVDPLTLTATPLWPFPAFTRNQYGGDNTPIQAPLALSNGSVVVNREFGGAYGTGLVADLDAGMVLKEFDDIPFTAVPRFSNATGAMPNGNLVEGTDGLIYGTSMYGGDFGAGVIYRVARDGSLFQVLHSFTMATRPYGGLVLASDGAFYGVTFAGAYVYRYTPPRAAFAALCEAFTT